MNEKRKERRMLRYLPGEGCLVYISRHDNQAIELAAAVPANADQSRYLFHHGLVDFRYYTDEELTRLLIKHDLLLLRKKLTDAGIDTTGIIQETPITDKDRGPVKIKIDRTDSHWPEAVPLIAYHLLRRTQPPRRVTEDRANELLLIL